MGDKRFYWLKLKEDFFEEPAIDWLLDQPKGKEYVAIYLMLCLKTINTDGCLTRQVGDLIIPYDLKKIAQMTRTDIDTIIVAFELFKKLNLVSILDNETFFIQQVQQMVGQSETKWAEYKRNQRLKDKNEQVLKLDNVQEESNEVLDITEDNVHLENRDKILDIRDKSKEKEIKDIKKKDTKKVETVRSIFESYTDGELLNVLYEFENMRKAINAKLTPRAAKMICNELDRLTTDTFEKIQIVEKSIMHSWKGVFPLRQENNYSGKSSAPTTIKDQLSGSGVQAFLGGE